MGRLPAVSPDMAELLVVKALHKDILNSICLHLDCDVAEAWQSENLLGFCHPWQGYKEKGQVYGFGFLGRGLMGGYYLLDANNVKAEAQRPVRYTRVG
jgi:hypothetical protein